MSLALQSEPEAWVVITKVIPLVLWQVENVVTLARRPLLVLPPHQEAHCGCTQGSNPHKTKRHTKACLVCGCLRSEENVGADDACNVANHNLDRRTESA